MQGDYVKFSSDFAHPSPGQPHPDLDGSHTAIAQRLVRERQTGPGLIERSTPLPHRLLMVYSTHTRDDRTFHARANAVFFACVAILPAFMVGGIVWKMARDTLWAIVAAGLVTAAFVLYSLWRDYLKHDDFWERIEWLDFQSRTWNSCHYLTNSSAPATRTIIDFNALALVYFSRGWEQGPSYEVALCTLSGWNRSGLNSPGFLDIVHSADTEAQALDDTFALSALWGIGCWRWTAGSPATLDRLNLPPA